MFWKKKPAKKPQAVLYRCLGPDYKREIHSSEGEALDDQKEKLFACIRQRELSADDISKLNERYEFDLWTGMVWIESDIFKKEKIAQHDEVCYRLTDMQKSLSKTTMRKVLEYFNFEHFYSVHDIIAVSGTVGADLMLDCSWQKYLRRIIRSSAIETEVEFYVKVLEH